MAKKKKGGGRKRPKPGLLEMLMYAAAGAEIMGGGMLKNPATDSLRRVIEQTHLPKGPARAAALVILGKLIHTEANKANINPSLLMFRML